MLGRTHFIFGIATASLALGPSLEAAALAGLGALTPDIDHPKSTLGRIIPAPFRPFAGIAAGTYGIVTGSTTIAISAALFLFIIFFPHRSVTHSLLALFVVSNFLPAAFALGYVSHIVADFISGGVPLFWPWRKRFGTSIFQTGGVGDVLLSASSLGLLLFVAGTSAV